MSAAPEGLF